MREINTVIFLGAGASASEKAPLQGELMREIKNLASSGRICDIVTTDLSVFDNLASDYLNNSQLDTNGQSTGFYNPDNLTLQDLFKDFWDIDLRSPRHKPNAIYPTLEECLGVLDLAILNSKSFKKYSLEAIRKARDFIIYLIARVLDEKLVFSESSVHTKLIKRLDNEDTLKSTAFISLNYDILIDNAIMRYHNSKREDELSHMEIPIEYGIKLNLFDSTAKFMDDSIKLLKIHGSMNWLYCPTCNEITLTPFSESVSTIVEPDVNCQTCESSYSPIIVPPTYYKDMSNNHLQNIYWEADNLLRKASKIFFCGYSFPDADMHIKYLFKRMELNQAKKREIYILNFHEEKKQKWETGENIDLIKY